MSALDPILRVLDRLSGRVDGKPDLRWAVVTQISPLRIRMDADENDLLAAPDTLVSPLLVGERVRVALQNRRVTVLGVAGRRTDLRGTTTQRNALGSSGVVTAGQRFSDVTDGREYVWRGGWAWAGPALLASTNGGPAQTTAADVSLNGLSLALTLATAQQIRFQIRFRGYGAAGAILSIKLKDAGTNVATWLRPVNSGGAGTPFDQDLMVVLDVPAGTHTYTVTAGAEVGASITSAPSVLNPNQLYISPA